MLVLLLKDLSQVISGKNVRIVHLTLLQIVQGLNLFIYPESQLK